MLTRLDIHNVRNLRKVSLTAPGRVNVVSGANGSGKTSVLEAIHLLAVGRSFRTQKIRSVVTHGSAECTVYGRSRAASASASDVALGISRSVDGSMEARVNGRRATGLSELARALPVRIINSDSFELLTGGPAHRRGFLNWGVFHVEHSFHAVWQHYRKCLSQRNALLRRGKIDTQLTFWTGELARVGEELAALQERHVAALAVEFRRVSERIIPDAWRCELAYRRGWEEAETLSRVFSRQQEVDLSQGFTHAGPHRCDVLVRAGGTRVAGETLSRGQQKLVVCALQLAQGSLLHGIAGRIPRGPEASPGGAGRASASRAPTRCVYLVDDLPAELDDDHAGWICSELQALDAQVWITAIDPQEVIDAWPGRSRSELTMFHVEHNSVMPVGS